MDNVVKRAVVLAVLGMAAGAAGVQAQPKIEIPETRYEFGRVFERKEYRHDFVVYNRGDADLVISGVRPGCGCTVANFDKVVQPGKQGKIELVLDGEKVHDRFDKGASVSSNDPIHPSMTIAISGTEVPFVTVEPAGTIYLHGRYGEHIERVVTVSSNEEELDFKVMRATSNLDDKITYKVEPTDKAGTYQVTVYKNPLLPTLMTSGTIYLHTNSEIAPKTELQVHVITKGDINVSPQVVNFGQVKFAEGAGSGQAVTRSVIVSKALGEFKITDVKLSNPNFSALVEPVGTSQYRVQVTFTPPLRSQTTQSETGEMIIHTDDAREPAIRVAVNVRAM